MPNTTLRMNRLNHSVVLGWPAVPRRLSVNLAVLLSLLTLAVAAFETRAEAAAPATSAAKDPSAKPAEPGAAAVPAAKPATPTQAPATSKATPSTAAPRSSSAARSQTPKQLLEKTAEIYPEDPALTAMIINKYLDCRVLRAQRESTLAEERARKDIAAAKEKAKEEVKAANLRAAKIEEEAKRAQHAAREEADKAVAEAMDDYAAHSRYPIATQSVKLQAVTAKLAPQMDFVRAEPVYAHAYVLDDMIPPNRSLPAKETIHPFAVKKTVDRLVELSIWQEVVDAWPGGCQP